MRRHLDCSEELACRNFLNDVRQETYGAGALLQGHDLVRRRRLWRSGSRRAGRALMDRTPPIVRRGAAASAKAPSEMRRRKVPFFIGIKAPLIHSIRSTIGSIAPGLCPRSWAPSGSGKRPAGRGAGALHRRLRSEQRQPRDFADNSRGERRSELSTTARGGPDGAGSAPWMPPCSSLRGSLASCHGRGQPTRVLENVCFAVQRVGLVGRWPHPVPFRFPRTLDSLPRFRALIGSLRNRVRIATLDEATGPPDGPGAAGLFELRRLLRAAWDPHHGRDEARIAPTHSVPAPTMPRFAGTILRTLVITSLKLDNDARRCPRNPAACSSRRPRWPAPGSSGGPTLTASPQRIAPATLARMAGTPPSFPS